jgi:hypothetical protein
VFTELSLERKPVVQTHEPRRPTMKKNIEITYAVIDTTLVNTSSLLTVAEKAGKTGQKLQKEEGALWNATVILSAPVLSQQFADKAAAYAALEENMSKLILPSIVIPEFITNGKGEQVPASKKDGSVKWSTWAKTKRIWAYLSDIAKVMSCGLAAELYPEAGKVAARCDILAACSGTETPIEGVRRYAKGLQGSLSLLEDPKEALEAHLLVGALNVPTISPLEEALASVRKLNVFLTSCNAKEKATILSAMEKLAEHFPNA